jgi:hypothetical protein
VVSCIVAGVCGGSSRFVEDALNDCASGSGGGKEWSFIAVDLVRLGRWLSKDCFAVHATERHRSCAG